MDRSTLEPRSPGRRLIVGPIEDLVRCTPRGVACGTPPSGVIASPPRPERPPSSPGHPSAHS